MTYYRYNALTRVLTAEPNYIELSDGATIANPSAEQNAELRDAYPKGEDAPMPTPPEGKVVEYGGYALGETDHLWHKQWVVVDAPPQPPRTFDKYRLVDALITAGVWDHVEAWLKETPYAWLRVQMAPDISEDEPLLKDGIDEMKKLLGWTDEDVERVLAASVI